MKNIKTVSLLISTSLKQETRLLNTREYLVNLKTILKIFGLKFANAPFLAGQMQMGKYDFNLIAPATSNTVAKIHENG